jgi:hypothetical protein
MKYFQDDFFRKRVLSAALLGMASSLAIAQDQAAPRPPGAQQMPVPLPAPQDPSGGELRLPPGPPPRGADFEPGAGSRRSESLVQMPGVVVRYLLNVFGEVDGLILADGLQVHFSPRMSSAMTTAIKPNDQIVLRGHQESNLVVRADSVMNKDTGRLFVDPGQPDGRAEMPPEIRGAQLQKLERSGRIVFVLYAPRGEIRGAVLEDGSQFLIPVRPAERIQFGLQAGASVDLKGYGTSNAFGTCLEATELSVNGGSAMILYGAN